MSDQFGQPQPSQPVSIPVYTPTTSSEPSHAQAVQRQMDETQRTNANHWEQQQRDQAAADAAARRNLGT